MHSQRSVVLSRVVVRRSAILAACLVAHAAPVAGAATGVGCDARLPVSQHEAGGAPARTPAGTQLPVACVVRTGYATSESTIGVTRNGTIVYSPASSENSVARSPDGGAHWYLTYPFDEQYTSLWNTDDPYLWVDRRTGRIFWSHATGPTRTAPVLVSNSPLPSGLPTAIAAADGFQVYSSADEGVSWTTADYSTAPTGDWEKVFTGPPSPGGAKPSGYPDVVYMCGNSPTEASGPGRLCYRSLDGGDTFAPAGYVFPSPTQPTDQCQALMANNGGVAPDGTVYQPVTCANGAYVAVSTDEGSTYQWRRITGAPPASGIAGVSAGVGGLQIAVDDAGELYAMWSTGKQIMVARSQTGGQTWQPPLDVTAPGLAQVALASLAAGPAGHLGIAYYGSTDPKAIRLTAYLTVTATGQQQAPLFTSAALNPPSQPIFQPSGVAGSINPRADYVGAAFDSHGTFWAGVVDQLGPPDANGNVATTGLVGHLAEAAAQNPARLACTRGGGAFTAHALEGLRLGDTRSAARRLFATSALRGRRYMDFFCGGAQGIRVGYPSPQLQRTLSRAAQRRLRGRVVLILTDSKRMSLRGIRPREWVAAVARRISLTGPFVIGANTWYVFGLRHGRAILKARHGVVQEIGIADPSLTRTRAQDALFLQSFS